MNTIIICDEHTGISQKTHRNLQKLQLQIYIFKFFESWFICVLSIKKNSNYNVFIIIIVIVDCSYYYY
jgi:hypothetical protein